MEATPKSIIKKFPKALYGVTYSIGWHGILPVQVDTFTWEGIDRHPQHYECPNRVGGLRRQWINVVSPHKLSPDKLYLFSGYNEFSPADAKRDARFYGMTVYSPCRALVEAWFSGAKTMLEAVSWYTTPVRKEP